MKVPVTYPSPSLSLRERDLHASPSARDASLYVFAKQKIAPLPLGEVG
ncbi:hypothetical protein BH09BAC1_BH09BAC1_22760 [soil metagenome]